MQYEPLTDAHIVEGFDCESECLNNFLKRAISDGRHSLNRTFVATPDGHKVVGFISLAYGQVIGKELPRDTVDRSRRDRSFPVILLGQLGVDKSWRKQGIGERLVYQAFVNAEIADRQAAIHGITVDAWEHAKGFYDRVGFEMLPGAEWEVRGTERTIKMYIPLKNIRQFLAQKPCE